MIVDFDQWAEDEFSRLCSTAGVTRNKSVQDRTGWDYLIEFRPIVLKEIPADLRPVDLSARVQIKSKRSGKASVALKLSNALRFAKDPLPCFVVLFLATKGDMPVRTFARHFWKEEISHALKRAREAHAGGREDINHLSMTLRFDDSDDHSEDLLKWMKEAATSQAARYTQLKSELVETVGFEDGSIHGNISVDTDNIEALIDHQIGLTQSAPPLKITVKQSRFGIDAASPLFEGMPDITRMQTHARACRVRVRGSAGKDIWLDGKLFLPALPNLPARLFKCRVIADFLEILIADAPNSSVTLNLDSNVQRSLPSLRALTNVFCAAKAAPLQIQISLNGNVMFDAVTNLNSTQSADYLSQLSDVIGCLEGASAGILPADLTLSVDDIYKAWNEIIPFNGMITGTNFQGEFEFDREIPRVGPVTSIFFYDYVDIGNWTFLAVVRRPVLSLDTKGNKLSLKCDNVRVVEALVRKGRGTDYLNEIQKLYARAAEFEGDAVLNLCDGDYRTFSRLAGPNAEG